MTGAPVLAGARGAAVLVLVLALLAPELSIEDPRWLRPFHGLLTASHLAVTVLLTCTGFAMTRRLQGAAADGVADYLRAAAAYVASVVALVVLVTVVVLVVSRVDTSAATSDSWSWESLRPVATFRLDSALQEGALGVRPDLAGLWYFSIELQLVAVLIALGWLSRSHPRVLTGIALTAAAGSWTYRAGQLDAEGWFVASLGTLSRADAFLLGVAAASALPVVRSRSGLVGSGLLLLGGTVIALSLVEVDTELMVIAPVAAVATALCLVGAERGGERELGTRLGSAWAAGVGVHWQAVVAWSTPVVVIVAANLDDVTALLRVLLTLVVLVVVVAVTAELARLLRGLPEAAHQPDASAKVGGEDRGSGGHPPAGA